MKGKKGPSDLLLVPWRHLEPDSGLTSMERLILCIIGKWVNTWSHTAYPGIDTIAAHAAVDERTVRRGIARLVKLGVVSVRARTRPDGERDTNLYTVRGYDPRERQVDTVSGCNRDSATGNRAQCPVENAPLDQRARSPVDRRTLTTPRADTGDNSHRTVSPRNEVVAVNELRENGEVNGTAPPAPPVVDTTGNSDGLPPNARQFEFKFYSAATRARQDDVRRQLLAVLRGGVAFRGGNVKAVDPDHLDAMCATVLVARPRADDAAMYFLLLRLNESFGETKAAREAAQFAREPSRRRSETSGPTPISEVVAKVALGVGRG
jgi:hypothetical protein